MSAFARRHIRSLIGILALALLATAAVAQEPAAQTFDLHAVIERTLEANPELAAARQTVATAQARVSEAISYSRPQVSAQAGYTRFADDPSFSIAGMGTMVFGKTDNPFANVALQWPLYTGGTVEQMIAASRSGVDAAWHGYARRRQEKAAEAAVAYYQALSAARMVDVMRQQVATLTEAVRVATALQGQGIVAKVDVLRPTADLESARAMLVQAENGRHLALTNLKRLMHLPMTGEIVLQPAEPGLPMPADQPAAVAAALGTRPEVRQLQAARQALGAQAAAARGERRPRIGLQAQYDLERMSTYPETGEWSVGIAVSQSLSDGGRAKAKEQQALSQARELQDQEAALQAGITMQVTNGLLSVRAAEERTKATTAALATAQEAYRMAEASYKNQVGTITDVLAAQTALTGARTQQALAQFDLHAAQVQLHLALGDWPAAAGE